ncbi:MAG: GNAT family N-acetyltransferase [Ferruginibacter sp.]
MSESAVSYELVQINPTDLELEKYRLCFEKNGTDRSIENLKWLHQQNLANTNLIYYAVANESGEIAGIYTALPNLLRLQNSVVPCLQSIDTLTDINHRGKGLFIKLAKQLYNKAIENKFELVYGFPNGNSAPGFFKKLNWTSFDQVPYLIKPFRISYFIKKLLKKKTDVNIAESNQPVNGLEKLASVKGMQLRPIDKFTHEYDALWEKAAKTFEVAIERDSKYMNWRYIAKPGEVYYRYGVYNTENVLQGIVVFALKNKHDGVIGYLMELIYDPAKPALGKSLLKTVSNILRKNKADLVLAWCLPTSYNFNAYKNAGYFILPDKVKPQDLFFGVRSLQGNNEIIEDLKNWYISYSDSDTV